ncbi:hypothetical protein G9A89_023909 [Geosiphon pyriformis]|nr:hypothetical protein G9A89_023909 [Geosiphon pyriformis]
MPLPKGKLEISGGESRTKVIQVNLTEEVLRILHHKETQGQNLSLRYDPKKQGVLTIRAGNESFDCVPNAKPVEISKVYFHQSSPELKFVGDVTSEATLKTLQDDIKFQNLRGKIKASTRAAEQQKQARKIVLLDDKAKPKNNPSQSISSRATATRPSKSSSTPSKSSTTEKRTVESRQASQKTPPEKSKGVPLRQRLIQLLALKELPLNEIVQKTRSNKEQAVKLLQSIAVNSRDVWKLKNEAYKEVKIYEWPQYLTREIMIVVDKATKAFNSLKLPKDAPEWRNLRPAVENGLKREAPASTSTISNSKVVTVSTSEHPEAPSTKRRKVQSHPQKQPVAAPNLKAPAAKRTLKKTGQPVKNIKVVTPSPSPAPQPSQTNADEMQDVIASSPSGSSITNASVGGKSGSPSSTSTSTSITITKNPPKEQFHVPRVNTLKLFNEQTRIFKEKYKRYSELFSEIQKKGKDLTAAMAQTEKADIAQQIRDEFGANGVVNHIVHEYTEIKEQLTAIKQELWRASKDEVFGEDEDEEI